MPAVRYLSLSRILRLFCPVAAAIVGFAVVSASAQTAASNGPPLAVPVPPSATGNGSYSGGGFGGGGGNLVVMVVDAEFILQKSKAGMAITSQLDQQQQGYQKELNAKQTELQTEQAEVQRAQQTDQFEEKRHAFEKKVADLQREVDRKKRGFSQGFSEALDKVKRALVEIVGGIAQERHANLVMLRSAVIIADPSYDVTEEALKRLDQKLPYVQVSVGSGEGAGGPAPAKSN